MIYIYDMIYHLSRDTRLSGHTFRKNLYRNILFAHPEEGLKRPGRIALLMP